MKRWCASIVWRSIWAPTFDQLEAALVERLGQALQKILPTRSAGEGTAAGAARRISAQQNDLDLIVHYLYTGQLPWWAERKTQDDLARILADLIDHAHRELIACLREERAPDNPVLSSLVRQFDVGMGSATTFYQSVFGLVLILTVNQIIKKVDAESSLF